jgi:hypothetical protein
MTRDLRTPSAGSVEACDDEGASDAQGDPDHIEGAEGGDEGELEEVVAVLEVMNQLGLAHQFGIGGIVLASHFEGVGILPAEDEFRGLVIQLVVLHPFSKGLLP